VGNGRLDLEVGSEKSKKSHFSPHPPTGGLASYFYLHTSNKVNLGFI